MSIIETSKVRFENAVCLYVQRVVIDDPFVNRVLDISYKIISNLSNEDPDQKSLRIHIFGLFRRLASYISADFSTLFRSDTFNEDFRRIVNSLYQYEIDEVLIEDLSKYISLVYDGTNYKHIAIKEYIASHDHDCAIITRAHKWSTIPITQSPFDSITSIDIDHSVNSLNNDVIAPLSPHLINSKILKNLFFCGGTRKLTIFLYTKERYKLPHNAIFISEDSINDYPLVNIKSIATSVYESPQDQVVTLSDSQEPDLFDELETTGSDKLVRILLATDEEILVSGNESVWVVNKSKIIRVLASELIEGDIILVRHDDHVEPPELYLDRSEVWRTPLRDFYNTGVSLKVIADCIQNRSGFSVNIRMIRSWVDGDVLGPDERSVFISLITELCTHKYIDEDVAAENTNKWWDDLRDTRMRQTSKGLDNREQILQDATRDLNGDTNESECVQYELIEIFVVEESYTDIEKCSDLGCSNRRKTRLFS